MMTTTTTTATENSCQNLSKAIDIIPMHHHNDQDDSYCQNNDDEVDVTTTCLDIVKPTRKTLLSKVSSRHGARNQNRSKHLCQWIRSTWDTLQADDVILDIAGGNGELSARLLFCHQFRVILIDPRPTNILKTFQIHVLPRLPKKHQERFRHRWETNPQSIHDMVTSRYQQLEIMFQEETVLSNPTLYHAVQTCKLMVGLHPDEATESIVDIAKTYGKPFVVIPCCVFPNFNPHRVLLDPKQNTTIPVRTHAQFCDYLLTKDTRFRREILSFQGRNVAIVWDGQQQQEEQVQQQLNQQPKEEESCSLPSS
jgi:hypothetical protein